MTIILSNLNRFTFFFTGRFPSKFAVKSILNILPHLAHVATLLPCETLMSAKQAINGKLQGSAGVMGLLITKLRKVCCCVSEKKLKSVNIWQSYKQQRVVACTLRAWLTQVNSALHPSGVAKSSTSFGWGKGGNVTSAGWQVTLCDPMWHVSSRSGVATLRTAIHWLLTHLLLKDL